MTSTKPETTEPDAVFDAELSTTALRQYLAPIDALAGEATIDVTHDAVATSVSDPARVAMADVTLDTDVTHTVDHTLGVNVDRLAAVVDQLPDDVTCGLSHRDDRRHLTVEGVLDGAVVEYEAATHDPDTVRSSATVPDHDTTTTVEFRAACEFQSLVSYFDAVGEHVWFESDAGEDALRVESIVHGTDEARWRMDRHDFRSFASRGTANSGFSLDYLRKIAGAIPAEASLRLHVGEHEPLWLEWDFAGGDGSVTYLQAPRVAGDDG